MTGWQPRFNTPGANLQRELDRMKGPVMTIQQGKQFCEAGQHWVLRPGYVTHKGWKCDACLGAS